VVQTIQPERGFILHGFEQILLLIYNPLDFIKDDEGVFREVLLSSFKV